MINKFLKSVAVILWGMNASGVAHAEVEERKSLVDHLGRAVTVSIYVDSVDVTEIWDFVNQFDVDNEIIGLGDGWPASSFSDLHVYVLSDWSDTSDMLDEARQIFDHDQLAHKEQYDQSKPFIITLNIRDERTGYKRFRFINLDRLRALNVKVDACSLAFSVAKAAISNIAELEQIRKKICSRQ